MKRILLPVLFGFFICYVFQINAVSSANNLFQTTSGGSGAPAAPVVTAYVIVDGPGAGTQLSTTVDPNSGKPTAGAGTNPLTKADGHIGGIGVGEGMNCPGPLGHYHGTLRGQPDPDPEKC